MNTKISTQENLLQTLHTLESENERMRDVLDKIRYDVEKKIIKRPWLDFKDMERDRNDAFLEVLDIIDKYRKESEKGV